MSPACHLVNVRYKFALQQSSLQVRSPKKVLLTQATSQQSPFLARIVVPTDEGYANSWYSFLIGAVAKIFSLLRHRQIFKNYSRFILTLAQLVLNIRNLRGNNHGAGNNKDV
jgi:hypothetical protein